nr:hypothetical protein [Tanacetum cinerariifolium]
MVVVWWWLSWSGDAAVVRVVVAWSGRGGSCGDEGEGGGSCGDGGGGWRVRESGVGDRLDRKARNIFGFGRKTRRNTFPRRRVAGDGG